MGFDVSRAATEALQSRLPFVDRLVSYLYFAGAAVLEQSSWDESGRGVTVVGRRGPDRPGGVLLAAPLPLSASLAGLPAAHPDASRGLDLLALAWALASLDEDRLREPVTLVAARPDPAGTALRSVLESGTAAARAALVPGAAPGGPAGPPATWAVLEVSAGHPVKPLRSPLRDVVRWDHAPGPDGGLASLASLSPLFAAGGVVPLSLEPGPGVHLGPPDRLSVVVGLREPLPPPPGWSEAGRPQRVGSGGSCQDRLEGLLEAARLAGDGVRAAWEAQGHPVPDGAVRLVDFCAARPASVILALRLPPRDAEPALQALEAVPWQDRGLEARLVADLPPGPPDPGDAFPAPERTAACLQGLVPRVLALAPGPDDGTPEGRAREGGRRCLAALEAILRDGGGP